MDTLLSIAPQLAFAAFLFYVFRWVVKHFDPHIIRLLDSIDDIRETGQRMAEIGERLIRIIETQQEWQEQLDSVLTDRHKRIMERFDAIDGQYTSIFLRVRECRIEKSSSYE